MRRLTIALVALALPAASLSAQRVRIPISRGGRGPERPAEKPPQAPGIHDARYYNRYALSRFSLETSPMLSYMQTSGFVAQNIPANFWTFGDATQLSFRAAPSLYMTGVFTSSAVGGPFALASSELGARVKPWTTPRVSPFVEGRMSWAYTSNASMPSGVVPVTLLYRNLYNDLNTGSGKGGLLGLGLDTRITARYSLTTTLSFTHYAMVGKDLQSARRWDYTNDATRLTIGLRYNHGRWLDAP